MPKLRRFISAIAGDKRLFTRTLPFSFIVFGCGSSSTPLAGAEPVYRKPGRVFVSKSKCGKKRDKEP
jgi:hypothetical protein